jgi:hypothetical protein
VYTFAHCSLKYLVKLFFSNNVEYVQKAHVDNALPQSQWSAIWIPIIKFSTTKEDLTSVQLSADAYSSVYVRRSGPGQPDSGQQLRQARFYNFFWTIL